MKFEYSHTSAKNNLLYDDYYGYVSIIGAIRLHDYNNYSTDLDKEVHIPDIM